MPKLKPNYLRYRPYEYKTRQLRLLRAEVPELVNELKSKLAESSDGDVIVGFGEDEGGCPVCTDHERREKGGVKLVRDLIPDKIRRNGEVANVWTASADYVWYLYQKLHEEIEELRRANTACGQIEELADVQQVLFALMAALGTTVDAVDEARIRKFAERGGFERRYLLEVEPRPVAKTE